MLTSTEPRRGIWRIFSSGATESADAKEIAAIETVLRRYAGPIRTIKESCAASRRHPGRDLLIIPFHPFPGQGSSQRVAIGPKGLGAVTESSPNTIENFFRYEPFGRNAARQLFKYGCDAPTLERRLQEAHLLCTNTAPGKLWQRAGTFYARLK